jgi:hypothetical protein
MKAVLSTSISRASNCRISSERDTPLKLASAVAMSASRLLILTTTGTSLTPSIGFAGSEPDAPFLCLAMAAVYRRPGTVYTTPPRFNPWSASVDCATTRCSCRSNLSVLVMAHRFRSKSDAIDL